MNAQSAVAVVVTYNRLFLLKKCIAALQTQSEPPTAIFVVNNASTDNTRSYLDSLATECPQQVYVCHLTENTGGAGGFSLGLKLALEKGADWVWMMDDDAEPHVDALKSLMRVATDSGNVYGSLAINGNETSWLMTLLDDPPRTVSLVNDIPTQADVGMLPFLGFLIHRDMVSKIGLPDSSFFIAADDVEYCIRARKAGARIIVAGNSHIEHPKSRPYKIRLPGYTLTALQLPPWKRYYDTRNRLLIARKYYGAKFYIQTIPGSFARMTAALVKEPHRFAQLKAFIAGFVDGLLGRKGRRHETWGIK